MKNLDNIRKRVEKLSRCPHCGKLPSDPVSTGRDLTNVPLDEFSDLELATWAGVSLDELYASLDDPKP